MADVEALAADQSTVPLQLLRARVQARLQLGGLLIAVAAVWALWPMVLGKRVAADSGVTDRVGASVAENQAVRRGTIDQSVFQAALWVPPPKPLEPVKVVPAPPPTPPSPLKLQLIGVRGNTDGAGKTLALLFDPDTARILHVGAGEKAQRYLVRSIGAEEVVLEEPEVPGVPRHTLRLHEKVAITPGGGRGNK